jgi:hypothetical protein
MLHLCFCVARMLQIWISVAGMLQIWITVAGMLQIWITVAGMLQIWITVAGMLQIWITVAGMLQIWITVAGMLQIWITVAGMLQIGISVAYAQLLPRILLEFKPKCRRIVVDDSSCNDFDPAVFVRKSQDCVKYTETSMHQCSQKRENKYNAQMAALTSLISGQMRHVLRTLTLTLRYCRS